MLRGEGAQRPAGRLEAPAWWSSVRVQGEAGGLLGTLAFLPPAIECLPIGPRGQRQPTGPRGAAHACSPHSRGGLLGAPPAPGPLYLLCPLPGALSWALASLCHPVLSWGPLLRVCWGALPLPSAPSPPLLSAGWEAVCGLARLFSPWDPEWRFVSCPGLCPSARGRPRTQRRGSDPEEKPGPGPGGRESLTPAGGRPLRAPTPCWLLGPVPAGLGRGRGRASSAGWGGLSVRGAGRDWPRGAGRVPFPAPGSHWGQAAGPVGARDCHVDTACTLPFLHACSGNELFPPPLLDSFPGGRAVGGEAAWGPGVALELRSLPRAVPSPGQAPSHTPTPPAPPGPRSPGVGGVGLLGCSQSQLCPQP